MDIEQNTVSLRVYVTTIIGVVTFAVSIITLFSRVDNGERYLEREKLRLEQRQQVNENKLNDLENRVIKLEHNCK